MKINFNVCIPKSSRSSEMLIKKNAYARLENVEDYLYDAYYEKLNYDFAKGYFKAHTASLMGGCSAVRNGDFVGRNFDWYYNEEAEFVVHTERRDGRLATIGVSTVIKELTDAFVKTRAWSELYKLVPFVTTDGMNEKGVFVSTNVVPKEKGDNHSIEAEVEEREEICMRMIPRYILDNFESAQGALEYIRDYVTLYLSTTYDYDIHFLIGDTEKTYLLEFVNGEMVFSEMEKPYITNFHLAGVELNADGSVYTPETQTASEKATTTNKIEEHGMGLERYNLINANYASAGTKEGMLGLMDSLKYTKMYDTAEVVSNPYWFTELVGDGRGVDSPVSTFAVAKAEAGEKFSNRSREEGDANYGTWQSMHSVVYDLKGGKMYLIAQESGVEREFELSSVDAGNAVET